MSSSDTAIKNIMDLYRTFTPNLHSIITDTISRRKGRRWNDKAFSVLTHKDLLENNQYMSDELKEKLDVYYKQLGVST